MLRALATALVTVCVWMGIWHPAEASAAALPPGATYIYDGHHHTAPPMANISERGPPAASDRPATYDATARRSDGPSARPNLPIAPATYDYDNLARFVQTAHGSPGVWEQVGSADSGSAIVTRSDVAANTAPQVLNGPIADAVPNTLPQQLALGAAKDGQGTIIMRNLADAPRLAANYGSGDWVKMQYVLRGTGSNVVVHYFRNLTTKMDVEFKFT